MGTSWSTQIPRNFKFQRITNQIWGRKGQGLNQISNNILLEDLGAESSKRNTPVFNEAQAYMISSNIMSIFTEQLQQFQPTLIQGKKDRRLISSFCINKTTLYRATQISRKVTYARYSICYQSAVSYSCKPSVSNY